MRVKELVVAYVEHRLVMRDQCPSGGSQAYLKEDRRDSEDEHLEAQQNGKEGVLDLLQIARLRRLPRGIRPL